MNPQCLKGVIDGGITIGAKQMIWNMCIIYVACILLENTIFAVTRFSIIKNGT